MEEVNNIWLDSMQEAFNFEIAQGDYVRCKTIIARLREEGFELEAKQLHNELMEATLGDFLVESNLD